MISIKNRILIYFFYALFLIALSFDAYKQEVNYSIIPIVLLAGILLIRHPEYLLYALMISIPWSVEFHFGDNLSIDFPDEPLMLLASAAAIIFIVYNRKKITYKKVHPVLIILLFQFLWMVITVICSTDILLSIKYSLAKSWYLMAFIGLPFFLFQNEKYLKRSALLLVISTLVAMFVALARQSQFSWSFEKVNNALVPFFRNHVIYSALLVLMVPIQIAIYQLSKSQATKIFIGCVVMMTIVALYLSYSRGSWIALIAGTVSYWLLKKRMMVLTFLVLVFLSIGFVFWIKANDRYLKYSNDYKTTIYHANFKEHLIATYKLKDLSNAERIYRWVAAIQMVKDNWRTGTGPTTFYEQYKSYTVPAFKTYVSDNKEHSTVHNYFLFVLIEQGVLGALIFVMLVASVFWYAQKVYFQSGDGFWKVVSSAVASIIAMECTVNFLSDMIEIDKVGSVFYLCLTVIVIADIKTRKGKSNSSTNVECIS